MSWKYYQKSVTISKERAYALLRRPIITEKATMGIENNEISFEVSIDATKSEIKAAVEKVFSVKVVGVNTSVLKGKTKRFRGVMGVRKSKKKAVIRLAEGDSIDIGASI